MPRPDSPTILAFDAAAGACSAALWREGAVAARRFEAMARGHAEALVPMIEAVMAGLAYDRLDAIAVTTGPGAYTGLRIAIATARGLALASGVPALGIDSPAVVARMARDAGATGALAVVLETKRADFYLQLFAPDGAAEGPPGALDGEASTAAIRAHGARYRVAGEAAGRAAGEPAGSAEGGTVALAGDAAARLLAAMDAAVPSQPVPARPVPGDGLADAAVLARLAAERVAADPGVLRGPPPRPLYLRPPDASPPAADRHRLRC